MNNKVPKMSIVFDRYKKASLTKKAAIEIRISYNYKQKWISTGIMLYSNQWKNNMIVNCPDALQISKSLDQFVQNIRQILLEMIEDGKIDIFSIPGKLQVLDSEHTSFLDYCKQRINIKKYGKAKGTIKRYEIFLAHFTSWGKIKHFEDITESNIIRYDQYMISEGMKPCSRWGNYHKFLNSIILDAIKETLITKNPYKWISLDKGKDSNGIDNCLTMEEFRQIKNAKMPTESLERVRDLFIFQTYTCLRYSDLARFDIRLVTEIKGMKVYIRASKKTKKPFTVPIISSAWEILMKYNGVLPIISNVKYNLYLKSVAQAAGLDYKLTTHWARHTGATLLINEGLDTKFITRICGHSSTKITEQVYAKLLDETVVEAVQEIKDKLE